MGRDRLEQLLSKYGLATVLALMFFWWLTSSVSGDVRGIKATLEQHMLESNFYLRAVCLNTAHDEAQRAACVPGR